MAFRWLRLLDCPDCGAETTAAVEYDRLGYPTCPACGGRIRDAGN